MGRSAAALSGPTARHPHSSRLDSQETGAEQGGLAAPGPAQPSGGPSLTRGQRLGLPPLLGLQLTAACCKGPTLLLLLLLLLLRGHPGAAGGSLRHLGPRGKGSAGLEVSPRHLREKGGQPR